MRLHTPGICVLMGEYDIVHVHNFICVQLCVQIQAVTVAPSPSVEVKLELSTDSKYIKVIWSSRFLPHVHTFCKTICLYSYIMPDQLTTR